MRLMATKSYSSLIFYLLVEHYGLLLLMNRAFSIITVTLLKVGGKSGTLMAEKSL